MAQAYSDPKRADDPYALPDIGVFFMSASEAADYRHEDNEPYVKGWYWQSCFPGCLPDGDPVGPFATEAEALVDAQDVT